jgi:hypothetical protein
MEAFFPAGSLDVGAEEDSVRRSLALDAAPGRGRHAPAIAGNEQLEQHEPLQP